MKAQDDTMESEWALKKLLDQGPAKPQQMWSAHFF